MRTQLFAFSAFHCIFRESTYRKRISLERGVIVRFIYLDKYWESIIKNAFNHQNYGIPQRFDLFYAMGLALVMEGLLSACYHICPNYSNFQFGNHYLVIAANIEIQICLNLIDLFNLLIARIWLFKIMLSCLLDKVFTYLVHLCIYKKKMIKI